MAAGVGGLDGNRGGLRLAGGLGGLDGALDVVRIERIDAQQLLRLGHRLVALAFLHEGEDLRALAHVGKALELQREAGRRILAELGDLGRTQQTAGFQQVGHGVKRLGEQFHGEVVPPGLKRLPPAVREILCLLCKYVVCHNAPSDKLVSDYTTPRAFVQSGWAAIHAEPCFCGAFFFSFAIWSRR